MNFTDENINHDHIYASNNNLEISPNQKDDTCETQRRKIRKKCDIQTEEDREEYFRQRSLNNASCRMFRMHRRSKLEFMMKKCTEYENLNRKLICQSSLLTQVIDLLKEHLRSLIPNQFKQNK